jgi:hypothetical protein
MARKPRPSEEAAKAAKAAKQPKEKKTKAAKAPKASKPGQKPVGKQPEATPSTIKLPGRGVIKKLIEAQLMLQGEISSLSGDMGKLASTAAEKHNVNKKAAGIAKSLEIQFRKNPKRFQETWFHLQEYFDEMGFQGKADRQGQLDLQKAQDRADEEDTGEGEETGGEAAADDGEPAGAEGARSPRMRLVDTPKSTADAMGEAIENDSRVA